MRETTVIREFIRKVPGMYIGDMHDGSGRMNLIREALGNCVDEHIAGRATRIEMRLHDDGFITVSDDGGGIPTEAIDGERSVLERALMKFHNTPSLIAHHHVHLWRFGGVGLCGALCLCDRFEVEVRRRGHRHRWSFSQGVALEAPSVEPCAQRDGTTLHFHPDPTLFDDPGNDRRAVLDQLRAIAWLFPSVTTSFNGVDITAPNGMADAVETIVREKYPEVAVYLPVQRARGRFGDTRVDAAWMYVDSPDEFIRSWANCQPTRYESHLNGFRRGLDALAGALPPWRAEARLRGLVAAVSVHSMAFRYNSPTRDIMFDPEIKRALEQITASSRARVLSA